MHFKAGGIMELNYTELAAWGGAISGIIGIAIIAWQQWKKTQLEVSTAENEADHKRRSSEAAFQAQEDVRIIDYWKALNAEITERSKNALAAVETKILALEQEAEKRREEHIKCQLDNAAMKVQLEHHQQEGVQMRAEIKNLRDRVATLEGRS